MCGTVKIILYGSDGQMAARGLIYSAPPRQVSGLLSKILTSQL
jgi:hypothetical protein